MAIVRVVPEPGTVDPGVEAMARMRDLCLMQTASQRDFGLEEILSMINEVNDSLGKLCLVNQKADPRNPYVILELRHKPHAPRSGQRVSEGLWVP